MTVVPNSHFLVPMLKSASGPLVLAVSGHTTAVATVLVAAFDSATRRRGLLGRDGLAPGEAIVIAPSNAIHTFRMRFPIDVIFAARDGRVLKTRARLGPNRMTAAWGAFAVIELEAGALDRAGVVAGQRLELRADATSPR